MCLSNRAKIIVWHTDLDMVCTNLWYWSCVSLISSVPSHAHTYHSLQWNLPHTFEIICLFYLIGWSVLILLCADFCVCGKLCVWCIKVGQTCFVKFPGTKTLILSFILMWSDAFKIPAPVVHDQMKLFKNIF